MMKNHAHDYSPLTGKGSRSAVIKVTTNQPALKSGSLGWANTKNRGLFKALLTAAASKTGIPARLREQQQTAIPGAAGGPGAKKLSAASTPTPHGIKLQLTHDSSLDDPETRMQPSSAQTPEHRV